MNRFVLLLLCGICAIFMLSCDKEQEIAVTSVSISQPSAEMVIGETLRLAASIIPADATDKTVIWASSKQTVATVSSDGLVTALEKGNTTITATAGSKVGSCVVTVSKGVVAVTSVQLNKTSLELVEGESETLAATVLPDDATDKTIIWSSSNASVVTVDAGIVTAVKAGKADVIAKAGTFSAVCAVVVNPPSPTSITINPQSLDLLVGQSEQLYYSILPENAAFDGVEWESAEQNIATVDNQGVVQAKSVGETVIRVKITNTDLINEIPVTVSPIKVTSLSISAPDDKVLIGDSMQLTAILEPSNATNTHVSWRSNDPSVFSVDDNGKVTALKEGTAIIYAQNDDLEDAAYIMLWARDITFFVTCSTVVGTEGSSSSGFYSYLRLKINVTNGKSIYVSHIMVVNQDNSVVDVKYDIGWISDYYLKTVTRTGSYYTYDAKGWWYEIKYTYGNQEYYKYYTVN